MARSGITYSEVEQVASALQGQGVNVTIDNIRARLGTGSRSTIGNHLRRWHEMAQDRPTVSLPSALTAFVSDLYARLTETAQAQAKIEVQSLETQLLEQGQELNVLRAAYAQLEAERTEQDQKIAELTELLSSKSEDYVEIKAQFQKTQAQLEHMAQQLEDKEEQNGVLQAQNRQFQRNLEHFQEQAAAQRVTERSSHERERNQWLQENTWLKTQVQELNGRLQGLVEELNTLHVKEAQALAGKEILEASLKSVENLWANTKAELREARQQEQQLKVENAELDQRLSQQRLCEVGHKERLTVLDEFITKTQDNLFAVQHENHALKAEIQSLQAQVAKALPLDE